MPKVRFSPHQHVQAGLSPDDVVRVVNDAFDQGSAETGIESRLILCTLRHFTVHRAMETARLVHRFKGSRVVALDLAADEAGFPIQPQVEAFRYAPGTQSVLHGSRGRSQGRPIASGRRWTS